MQTCGATVWPEAGPTQSTCRTYEAGGSHRTRDKLSGTDRARYGLMGILKATHFFIAVIEDDDIESILSLFLRISMKALS